MKNILIIGLAVLVVVAAGGYFGLRYLMSQPLYKPGAVSVQQATLFSASIKDEGDNFWRVQDGIRLHHFAVGQGRNVLVLHGGPGAPFVEPLPGLAPLTEKYTFHYYDQRGSGLSSRPIDTFSSKNFYQNAKTLEATLGLTAQVADIERIRRHLQDEKLILIGHSFGAFLAAMYAAEFPQRVEAMVLISPASVLVMPSDEGDLYRDVKALLPEEMHDDYENYIQRYLNFGSLFEKNEQQLMDLNMEFIPYYQAALASKGLQLPDLSIDAEQPYIGGWMVQAMYMSMGQQHDYRDALKNVQAPVLVLHGDLDLQTQSSSKIYAEQFPRAEFKIIQGASHFSFSEKPEQFSILVGEFLKKINQ